MGVGGMYAARLDPTDGDQAAVELGNRIADLSAHVHAAMAELVAMAAQFDGVEGWRGHGYRSFAHWLSVNCGFDSWVGHEVSRVAAALTELPLVQGAFREGRLSFDKVRAVTRVACADEDEMWVNLALDASGSQLARICRAVGQALDVDGPLHSREQRHRRGVRAQWLKNGMLHVVALLPPDDGKLLLEALDAAMSEPGESADAVSENALDTRSARREDALMLVLSKGLGMMQEDSPPIAARHQVVVHVDFDLLTGLTPTGRCFLEDGPAIALETLTRIGCTAGVVAMIERKGKVLDVLPERRYPTIRQRRMLAQRDRTCMVPGCGVRARDCEAHHTNPWAFSHRTLVDEMASLCSFHHQRLHEGAFRMIRTGPGKFRFETSYGQPFPRVPVAINPATGGPADLRRRAADEGLVIDWETPLARGAGEPFDLDVTVDLAVNNPRMPQYQRGFPVQPAP